MACRSNSSHIMKPRACQAIRANSLHLHNFGTSQTTRGKSAYAKPPEKISTHLTARAKSEHLLLPEESSIYQNQNTRGESLCIMLPEKKSVLVENYLFPTDQNLILKKKFSPFIVTCQHKECVNTQKIYLVNVFLLANQYDLTPSNLKLLS